MAQRGHHVTLCEFSAEMWRSATGREKARRQRQHAFYSCAAQDIPQHLDSQVDLILFHAVLEWVAIPRLSKHCGRCCPGGALSLMFYNANGLLMRNVFVGNFGYVQQGMYKRTDVCPIFRATRSRSMGGWRRLAGR
ncbi:methyltransferase domain-containing protein [Shigella flexneri]